MTEHSQITGRTGVMFILADPIEHVKTPQRLNQYMRRNGLNAVLVPLHTSPSDLEQVITGVRTAHNLLGLVITVPHKISVLQYCDQLDASAERVGAVNVIRRLADGRLVGANFDGKGFLKSIEDASGPVTGKRVYIAGAGGVARSIAFSFAEAGACQIAIYNRSADKADSLISSLELAYPSVDFARGTEAPAHFDIAVNGTSLGLKQEDAQPFSIAHLPMGAVVGEVVMEPLITKLIAAARARGLNTVTGDIMLEHQLEAIVDFLQPKAGQILTAEQPY